MPLCECGIGGEWGFTGGGCILRAEVLQLLLLRGQESDGCVGLYLVH